MKGRDKFRKALQAAGARGEQAMGMMKQVMLMHIVTTYGPQVWSWITSKQGRKIVVENDGDGSISVEFLDDGKQVEPDFLQ